MLNVKEIRSNFKMYDNHPNLVYLDSGATSLTPNCVVEAMSDYYYNYRATVHRSKYKIGTQADIKYNESREIIANFIGAKSEEIIFTKSTTSAINHLAYSLTKDLTSEDHILISELDHHSNVLPWREYNKDIVVDYLKLDDNLKVTIDNFKASLHDNTRLVSLNHVSNVIGDIIPVKEIAQICHERNITFVVDGAQAITHEPVDVKDLGVDFYVFSGHKMLGPTGIGVCYVNSKFKKDIRFDYGGDMTIKVTKDDAVYADRPVGLEGGTPSIAEVIGLAEACKFLTEIGMDNISLHISELKKYLVEQLEKIDGVVVYNKDSNSGIIIFNIKDYIRQGDNLFAAHDVLSGLENSNDMICIRGGHMCNLLSLGLLNVRSILRASIYLYNDKEDIDIFVKQIEKISNSEIDIIGDIF